MNIGEIHHFMGFPGPHPGKGRSPGSVLYVGNNNPHKVLHDLVLLIGFTGFGALKDAICS